MCSPQYPHFILKHEIAQNQSETRRFSLALISTVCCYWSQLFRWVVFLVPHGFTVSPLSSWEYLWVLKPGFWNIGVSAMSGETRNVMILVLTGNVGRGTIQDMDRMVDMITFFEELEPSIICEMVKGWWKDGERMVKGWWKDGERMMKGWWKDDERWNPSIFILIYDIIRLSIPLVLNRLRKWSLRRSAATRHTVDFLRSPKLCPI